VGGNNGSGIHHEVGHLLKQGNYHFEQALTKEKNRIEPKAIAFLVVMNGLLGVCLAHSIDVDCLETYF
jgi:hypothetical protein